MGACTQPGNLMIILEYMPRGNLKSLLQKQDLPFKTKMNFCKQICKAMSWLHSNNPPFIHRDLKTSNILVAKNDVVKIADFGLSFIKKESEEGNFGTVGTPLWMA
jgi:serine/threonine protein kinase